MMMSSALLLLGFLQCQLTETTIRGQKCHPIRTHYPDSEPTSLCSFSLAEKQQIPINFKVFGLTRSGLKPTIYRTRGEYANHYTTHTHTYIYKIKSDKIKIILFKCHILINKTIYKHLRDTLHFVFTIKTHSK